MSPEELDEARAKEALRRLVDSGKVYCHEDIAALGARLARENWTPPEPVVDPDVLAWREWAARRSEANGSTDWASKYRQGRLDQTDKAQAYLAGARMAREQERERAGPLLDYVKERAHYPDGVGGRALAVLAKYRGEP